MQGAVELSLHAPEDTKGKPVKRTPPPARFGNGRPAGVFNASAAPQVPYQDPRRPAPPPQRTSLIQELAAASRQTQPKNVTAIGELAHWFQCACIAYRGNSFWNSEKHPLQGNQYRCDCRQAACFCVQADMRRPAARFQSSFYAQVIRAYCMGGLCRQEPPVSLSLSSSSSSMLLTAVLHRRRRRPSMRSPWIPAGPCCRTPALTLSLVSRPQWHSQLWASVCSWNSHIWLLMIAALPHTLSA